MVVVAFDRRRPDLRGMAVGAFPGISQPFAVRRERVSGGEWPCRSSDGAPRPRRRRGPSKFRELPSVLDSKTMLLPIGKIGRVVTERMILLRRSLRECAARHSAVVTRSQTA